jgi:hypothetical protein
MTRPVLVLVFVLVFPSQFVGIVCTPVSIGTLEASPEVDGFRRSDGPCGSRETKWADCLPGRSVSISIAASSAIAVAAIVE